MQLALVFWFWLAPDAHAAPPPSAEQVTDARSTASGPMLAGLARAEGLAAWETRPGRDDVGKYVQLPIDPGWCPECAVSPPADNRPDLDTRFMAPTHSRIVTALAAGVLATRGVLDLDETIAQALGVDVDPRLADARVVDLLGGGFQVQTPSWLLALDRSRCCISMERLRRPGARQEEPVDARRRVAQAVARRPPARSDHQHGRLTFEDSTHPDVLGPVLLAAILERKTGQSWEALVGSLVLGPLGLGPLRHGPDPAGPAGLVWRFSYLQPRQSKGRWVEVRRDPGAHRPAAGLQLSTRELVVLAQELMDPKLGLDPALRARLLFGDGARPGLLARGTGRRGTAFSLHAEQDGFWDQLLWVGTDTDAPEDDLVFFAVGAGSRDTIAGDAIEAMRRRGVELAP